LSKNPVNYRPDNQKLSADLVMKDKKREFRRKR